MRHNSVTCAALAEAHSPSGCAIRCIAVGAIPIGRLIRCPRTRVDRSRCETSTSIRGKKRYLQIGISNICCKGKVLMQENYFLFVKGLFQEKSNSLYFYGL